MCEAPPRPWRELIRPQQFLLGGAALAFLVAGIVVRSSAVGITLIGLGAALLFSAVVMPAVSRVEYGFPSGVKITADLRNREEALRRAFEDQRPDFEQCAKLLCDDPATATELVTAAMARAAAGWRGPVHREIRLYVLCWFVHSLMAHSRLTWLQQQPTLPANNLLSQLTQLQRIVVVLNEFADVAVEDIAGMVGRSPAEVDIELKTANAVLAEAVSGGGAVR